MKLNKAKIELLCGMKGLGFVQLAKLSKVSPNTLSKAKNNQDINPVSAGNIARALGVELAELVVDEEE